MKIRFLFLVTFFITNVCFGQKIDGIFFEDNYNLLMENLSSENWSRSEELTQKLLESVEPIDSMQTEKRVLRYIYLYSIAGLLNENNLTKDDTLKKVKFLKSKEMIMPSHPFNSKCYVNCAQFVEDKANTFFTGVNNAKVLKFFHLSMLKLKRD
jgi:hypothetical protein